MYFLHYTPCIESKNIMLREFLAADVQRIIGIRPIRAVQARWWNVGSRSRNAKGNAESDEQGRNVPKSASVADCPVVALKCL